MILRSFRIKNFKCFRDTGAIELKSGFNIFVGQNNSGKSTLLQALKYIGFDKPHNSSAIKIGEALNPNCELDLYLKFDSTELQSFCLRNGANFELKLSGTEGRGASQDPNEFLEQVLTQGEFVVQLKMRSGESTIITAAPEHSLYGALSKDGIYLSQVQANRKSMRIKSAPRSGDETITHIGKSMFDNSLFHFDAQRTSLGRCPYSAPKELTSNASNLARAMLELTESPALQIDLNRHFEEIIPSIKWIVAAPATNGDVEIKCSAYPQELARRDLLVPLDQSGTGVGQVVAILFAAITFQEPKIILIDEPNSFLHPGAAKRLIEVLKKYDRHQYILTTHSAEIIAASEPETIHRTSWEGRESIIEALDRKSLQDLEGMLADLGVTMSDVFGANAILWVEGMTEQLCFPKLLNASSGFNPSHIKAIALKDVGRLDKAKASSSVLWDAFEKLCKANALMPPTVAFCLDPEGRKLKERKEIAKLSGGKVKFLPRRNYECYLLHENAISAALSEIDFDETVDVSVPNISKIISELGGNKEFHADKHWVCDIKDRAWLENVDGAKLLEAIFSKVAIGKAVYQKTTHSVFLTEWLIENDPGFIKELIEFVSDSAGISSPIGEQAEYVPQLAT